MIVKNRISFTFGNFGIIFGCLLIISGVFVLFYSLVGITTILVGLFLALTTTNTYVDCENKKMKFSNNLFGIIKLGKWYDINSNMLIKIVEDKQQHKYQLNLYNSNDKLIMPIKISNNKEILEQELEKINKSLFS